MGGMGVPKIEFGAERYKHLFASDCERFKPFPRHVLKF